MSAAFSASCAMCCWRQDKSDYLSRAGPGGDDDGVAGIRSADGSGNAARDRAARSRLRRRSKRSRRSWGQAMGVRRLRRKSRPRHQCRTKHCPSRMRDALSEGTRKPRHLGRGGITLRDCISKQIFPLFEPVSLISPAIPAFATIPRE